MNEATHRTLVFAWTGGLLLPTTLVTLPCFAFAVMFALSGDPSALLVASTGLVAMLALVATWTASGAYRRHGDDGLRVLWPPLLVAMRAGVVLVAIGGVGALVERVAAPIDTGALQYNLLGVLAVVPCLHLLWLRARAMRGQRLPAESHPVRTWLALAALGMALLALQWLATGPLRFDRADWDASSSQRHDAWHRRQRMADQLLLDGSLLGRRRADVVARLGTPARSFTTAPGLAYELGEGRGIDGFDSETLWLSLDADGRVVGAELIVDND